MNLDALVVHDGEGVRRFGPDQLPLRLGTGSDCEIRVPGPGSAAVATLDQLDGQPFVQPVGRGASVSFGGEQLNTARRLADGDELGFFGTRVKIGWQDGVLSLRVQLEDSAYVTRPPEMPDTAQQEETIAPAAFKRAAEVAVVPGKSSYRWQGAVAVAIVFLVAVSYLLFSSKSIQFEFQPGEPDSFSISGGWFRLPLADRVLLREGTYVLEVEKQGYYPLSQTLDVDAAPSRTVSLELRRLPGQLTVATDPPANSMVTVNDTEIGEAPFGPIELEPGTYSVSVRADRYLPFNDRVEVPGLGLHQELEVQLVPQWANVAVASVPSGATVYQGEERLGVTPVTLELIEGSHNLTVIADGFKAWDGSVETSPNEDQSLPVIRLEPANAQLQVNSIPRGANVTVNGRYRGQSPIRLALSPDIDYQIGLSKAGYGATVRNVRLEAAAARAITVDLTARVGEVTVNALPKEATVFIDGRARGSGSLTMNLSSSPHRLEVKLDGHESFSRSVTPRPGYPQTIQVRLLSAAEVAARSTSSTVQSSQGHVLRRVEPGAFTMGSSRREQGRRANEVIVPVVITRPFFIGSKEVSNRDFNKFRKDHVSGEGLHASLAGDLNPVVNVSWADAAEYCNWLSTQEGLTLAYEKKFEQWQPITPTPNGYRLPTEAEWVWAIRYQGRSSAQAFPWGTRLPPRKESGNYADRSSVELVPSILPGYDDGFASTAPAGTFAANLLGIYDGGGNVAEWVQDYYSVPTPGQVEPLKDPTGPVRGANRVIRGSGWRHSGVTELRLSYRDYGNRGRVDVGFRVARNVQ